MTRSMQMGRFLYKLCSPPIPPTNYNYGPLKKILSFTPLVQSTHGICSKYFVQTKLKPMNLCYLPNRVIFNQRNTNGKEQKTDLKLWQKIYCDSGPYLRLIRFDRPIGNVSILSI